MILIFGNNSREKNEKLVNVAANISKINAEKISLFFWDSEEREFHRDYKVDNIFLLRNNFFKHYNYDDFYYSLSKFLDDNDVSIFLFKNTIIDMEIAHSLANRRNISIIDNIYKIDCSDDIFCKKISIEDGNVTINKLDLNRKNILIIKSLDSNFNNKRKLKKEISIIDVDLENTKNYKFIRDIAVKKNSINEAKIIFSGGLGIANDEDFGNLKEISKIYNAAIGGSRPMVELGFINSSEQIGQTGNIVSPDVYVAVGVSGSIQHLAGIRNAKNIIAINTDKNANIYNFAKYGVVKDAKVILQNILDIIRESSL